MPYEIIGGIALASGVVVLFIVVSIGRTLRMKTVASNQAMVGQEGQVKALGEDAVQVLIHGERWKARSAEPLMVGQTVTVTSQDGLFLHVSPTDTHTKENQS